MFKKEIAKIILQPLVVAVSWERTTCLQSIAGSLTRQFYWEIAEFWFITLLIGCPYQSNFIGHFIGHFIITPFIYNILNSEQLKQSHPILSSSGLNASTWRTVWAVLNEGSQVSRIIFNFSSNFTQTFPLLNSPLPTSSSGFQDS